MHQSCTYTAVQMLSSKLLYFERQLSLHTTNGRLFYLHIAMATTKTSCTQLFRCSLPNYERQVCIQLMASKQVVLPPHCHGNHQNKCQINIYQPQSYSYVLTSPPPGCLWRQLLPGTWSAPGLSASPLPHAGGQMRYLLCYCL